MKVLKYIGGGLCAVLLLWMLVSWADIVADNSRPNPQHYDWNFFIVFFNDKQEEEYTDSCGDPLALPSITATAIQKDGNTVKFMDEDGNIYIAEVGDPNAFPLYGYYILMFDDNNDILKAFVEVW